MPEIIKDDVNGYVVPKRNHEVLAARIIKLLKDKQLRERLGKTGRKILEEKYTKEIYAKKVCDVYQQAIDRYLPHGKKTVPKAVMEAHINT